MADDQGKAAQKSVLGSRVGIVTSDARDKTRTVVVTFQAKHPKYGKILRRKSTFQVHDPENQSKLGDRVEIANCKPISKTKSWRLLRIVASAASPEQHKTEV
ncbi:MAG: 30S ribosomal protein S17 [Phycisphaeraceae bacterium]|nr:30S ribosomal protein S17 [Phycisphaeraceae bacterium]|tara:strand:+ start:127 stop:432 length:306 start_codon:yes stop_codon:yes gene_type:complete